MTTQTHPVLQLSSLRAYFEKAGIPMDGDLRASLITGGKSNLTFLVTDNSSRWVLRRPPTAGLTPSAHDVAREFRVIAALQGTGVPVAPAIALCEDPSVLGAPFSVVGFVAGSAIQTRQDLSALTDAQVETCVDELVRALAGLHQVDHTSAGLGGFGRSEGYLSRQVAIWANQWQRVKTQDSSDLDQLHALLADSVPSESRVALVHGDFRIDNTILSGDYAAVNAVVDWEMSTIGDPLADAALMCVYRNPALDLALGQSAAWTSPRLPSAAALAERYAHAADRDLPHWSFYVALANFKVAVIAQGINHRYEAGATVGEGFDRAGEAVPEFIAAGLRAMRSNHA
ncbi:MAG: phosphotransferase family protein [Mycolicibacterium cosmeticum]|nr:phosphotransferase family protein [Mycolicibacterium cosmeticum]